VKHFSKALKSNSTLTRLSITAVLTCNTAMDDEMKDLQDNHRARRSIRRAEEEGNAHLDLADLKLGDSGAIRVAELVERSHKLLGLNLERCEIGDEGAARLAKALETNASVLEISLAGNAIGDMGAQRFTDVLRQNETIYHIDLGGNPVGAAMQRELVDHALSRVTFGSSSNDRCCEKLPTDPPRDARSSTLREAGSGVQQPQSIALSKQSSQITGTLPREPSAEEEEGDEEIPEEASSSEDEPTESDESEHFNPDESEHSASTDNDSVTDIESDLSDEAPNQCCETSIQNRIVVADI